MGAILSSLQTSQTLALAERNQLVIEQLPQVRFIAQKIHSRLPHHVQLEDLINTGVLGLIEALGKFDPGRNVELRSYASYRIRGAILDSLREQDWGTRLLRQKGRQLELAREAIQGKLGRNPSRPELATEMGISEEALHSLLSDLQGLPLASLQDETSADGYELADKLADDGENNPFEQCCRSEMNNLLARAITLLSLRKQSILHLYYFKGMTMKEIGNCLGVCESRISQMHTAALNSLRMRMKHLLQSRKPALREEPPNAAHALGRPDSLRQSAHSKSRQRQRPPRQAPPLERSRSHRQRA